MAVGRGSLKRAPTLLPTVLTLLLSTPKEPASITCGSLVNQTEERQTDDDDEYMEYDECAEVNITMICGMWVPRMLRAASPTSGLPDVHRGPFYSREDGVRVIS